MPYDPAKIHELYARAQTGSLTTSERATVREQIGSYHAKKLMNLQSNLFEALGIPSPEKQDPFEIEEYIHHYHKQSQELFTYINYAHSFSNASLLGWLREMDEEERGIHIWQPATQLPGEETREK